jgi:hypothetical protein
MPSLKSGLALIPYHSLDSLELTDIDGYSLSAGSSSDQNSTVTKTENAPHTEGPA